MVCIVLPGRHPVLWHGAVVRVRQFHLLRGLRRRHALDQWRRRSREQVLSEIAARRSTTVMALLLFLVRLMLPADDPATVTAPPRHRTLRTRLRHLRARVRGNPRANLIWRIIVGVLGGLVLVAGIIAIPYPGPGWLIVFAGLAILATEFTWARRVLRFARHHYDRGSTGSSVRPSSSGTCSACSPARRAGNPLAARRPVPRRQLVGLGHWTWLQSPLLLMVGSRGPRAISSGGERFVHTEEVTGSIPVSPTHKGPGHRLARAADQGLRHARRRSRQRPGSRRSMALGRVAEP